MASGVVFEETPSYYGLKNKIAIFSHEYSFEQIFKKKKRGGAWWISCFHQSSAVLGRRQDDKDLSWFVTFKVKCVLRPNERVKFTWKSNLDAFLLKFLTKTFDQFTRWRKKVKISCASLCITHANLVNCPEFCAYRTEVLEIMVCWISSNVWIWWVEII